MAFLITTSRLRRKKNKEEKLEEGLKETKEKTTLWFTMKIINGVATARLCYFPRLVIEQRKASTTINDHTLPADSVKADRSLE